MEAPQQNTDDNLLTLAFYIVVDVSISMVHSGALDSANRILPTVLDGIVASPMLADVCRVGMVDFSDDARVVLRLDDARNVKTIPQCSARGGTSYAAAFRLLRKEIEADMQQLKSDGFRVYRPAVFFITDGAPTDTQDDLRDAFGHLTDPSFKYRPNIIPFGVDGASKEMVDPWVHPATGHRQMRSYVTGPDVDPAAAITQLAEVLLGSILASAGSVSEAGAGGGFIPPDDDDLGSEWN